MGFVALLPAASSIPSAVNVAVRLPPSEESRPRAGWLPAGCCQHPRRVPVGGTPIALAFPPWGGADGEGRRFLDDVLASLGGRSETGRAGGWLAAAAPPLQSAPRERQVL